jgi:ribosomal-protein-alanine N-acetyltransferase
MTLIRKLKVMLGATEQHELYLRPLKDDDLEEVLAIEGKVYQFPWSRQIFKDCLQIGYSSWGLIKEGRLVGYAIVSIAVQEAHILNICIDPEYQRQGLGYHFVEELFIVAKENNAAHVFLEVRPSNTAAVSLYEQIGFKEIGRRKNYYPGKVNREDALVLSYDLLPEEV